MKNQKSPKEESKKLKGAIIPKGTEQETGFTRGKTESKKGPVAPTFIPGTGKNDTSEK